MFCLSLVALKGQTALSYLKETKRMTCKVTHNLIFLSSVINKNQIPYKCMQWNKTVTQWQKKRTREMQKTKTPFVKRISEPSIFLAKFVQEGRTYQTHIRLCFCLLQRETILKKGKKKNKKHRQERVRVTLWNVDKVAVSWKPQDSFLNLRTRQTNSNHCPACRVLDLWTHRWRKKSEKVWLKKVWLVILVLYNSYTTLKKKIHPWPDVRPSLARSHARYCLWLQTPAFDVRAEATSPRGQFNWTQNV